MTLNPSDAHSEDVITDAEADETTALHRRPESARLDSLILEDRVLISTLYRSTPMVRRPTDPIDIPSVLDIVQGLPTHVKSKKRPAREMCKEGRNPLGSVDMACARRLFLLNGHQRLIFAFYDDGEDETSPGVFEKIRIYHTFIEMILSPTTLAAMRGDVSVDEVALLKEAMSAYKPDAETLPAAKEAFHAITKAMRPRMGISKIHAKIDEDQSRPQASISVAEMEKQLALEGGLYHGRVTQENCREYTGKVLFHGIQLPWRTTAKDQIFKKPSQRASALPGAQSVGGLSIGPCTKATPFRTDKGTIIVMRHEGGAITICPQDRNGGFHETVSRLARDEGGTEIEATRSWLLEEPAVKRILQALGAMPAARAAVLPGKPGSVMRLATTREHVVAYDFDAGGGAGKARALRLDDGKWAMRSQRNEAVAARIDAGCRALVAAGVLHDRNYHRKWSNWLIPAEPPELLEKVARAIQNHP